MLNPKSRWGSDDEIEAIAKSESKTRVQVQVRVQPQAANPAIDTADPEERTLKTKGRYLSVKAKFTLALVAGFAWMALSIVAADAWIQDLSKSIGPALAYLVIYGIAVIPGFMNAFLVVSLLLDKRPPLRDVPGGLPGITILVAAYNEQDNIVATVESIALQNYQGPMQVIVINDGSVDATAEKLATLKHPWLQVMNLDRNVGKANALNLGLERVKHSLTITVDGDS